MASDAIVYLHACYTTIYIRGYRIIQRRKTGARTEVYIGAWVLNTAVYLPLAVASTLSPAFLASSAALF